MLEGAFNCQRPINNERATECILLEIFVLKRAKKSQLFPPLVYAACYIFSSPRASYFKLQYFPEALKPHF